MGNGIKFWNNKKEPSNINHGLVAHTMNSNGTNSHRSVHNNHRKQSYSTSGWRKPFSPKKRGLEPPAVSTQPISSLSRVPQYSTFEPDQRMVGFAVEERNSRNQSTRSTNSHREAVSFKYEPFDGGCLHGKIDNGGVNILNDYKPPSRQNSRPSRPINNHAQYHSRRSTSTGLRAEIEMDMEDIPHNGQRHSVNSSNQIQPTPNFIPVERITSEPIFSTQTNKRPYPMTSHDTIAFTPPIKRLYSADASDTSESSTAFPIGFPAVMKSPRDDQSVLHRSLFPQAVRKPVISYIETRPDTFQGTVRVMRDYNAPNNTSYEKSFNPNIRRTESNQTKYSTQSEIGVQANLGHMPRILYDKPLAANYEAEIAQRFKDMSAYPKQKLNASHSRHPFLDSSVRQQNDRLSSFPRDTNHHDSEPIYTKVNKNRNSVQ